MGVISACPRVGYGDNQWPLYEVTPLNTKTQLSTRERVLETCRSLFNERGPGAVTTAEIAATVGINEGNLYYYFKKKEEMVLALFDQFELALVDLGRLQMANEENDVDEDSLMDFFKLAWDWRFFYRDAATLYELAPQLRARNKGVAATTHEGGRRLLRRMVERGHLIASPIELERLVVNTWIIATFWIEYLQVTQGVKRITRKHLEAGYAQVQALFWPYVPEGTRSREPRWN